MFIDEAFAHFYEKLQPCGMAMQHVNNETKNNENIHISSCIFRDDIVS